MGIWLDEAEREIFVHAVLEAWPDSDSPDLVWLGEGFGSAAFKSSDGTVVLVAKNDVGARSRRVTCAVTPELAPMLSIGLPLPQWNLESSPRLHFGAYAYPMLPGRKMTLEDIEHPSIALVSGITTFLRAMHTVPVSRALDLGLPDFDDPWEDLTSLRSTTDDVVRQELTAGEYAKVQSWWDHFLADEALLQAPRCLVHGDLWPDNMLVDEHGRNLLGIIDFGDVNIIDAAYDFATLRLSRPLLAGVLGAYTRLGGVIDEEFEHRVERWWELRSGSWFSLRAAIRADDPAELHQALGELRRSPALSR